MTAQIWIDSIDSCDLGPYLSVIRTVGELESISLVAKDADKWILLASIPDELEQEVGEEYFTDLQEEAKEFLQKYNTKLSDEAQAFLLTIVNHKRVTTSAPSVKPSPFVS